MYINMPLRIVLCRLDLLTDRHRDVLVTCLSCTSDPTRVEFGQLVHHLRDEHHFDQRETCLYCFGKSVWSRRRNVSILNVAVAFHTLRCAEELLTREGVLDRCWYQDQTYQSLPPDFMLNALCHRLTPTWELRDSHFRTSRDFPDYLVLTHSPGESVPIPSSVPETSDGPSSIAFSHTSSPNHSQPENRIVKTKSIRMKSTFLLKIWEDSMRVPCPYWRFIRSRLDVLIHRYRVAPVTCLLCPDRARVEFGQLWQHLWDQHLLREHLQDKQHLVKRETCVYCFGKSKWPRNRGLTVFAVTFHQLRCAEELLSREGTLETSWYDNQHYQSLSPDFFIDAACRQPSNKNDWRLRKFRVASVGCSPETSCVPPLESLPSTSSVKITAPSLLGQTSWTMGVPISVIPNKRKAKKPKNRKPKKRARRYANVQGS